MNGSSKLRRIIVEVHGSFYIHTILATQVEYYICRSLFFILDLK